MSNGWCAIRRPNETVNRKGSDASGSTDSCWANDTPTASFFPSKRTRIRIRVECVCVCVGAQCKVRACVHSLQASSSSSSSSSTSFLCFLVLWAQQQQHQFLFNLILFPPALCLYFLLLCLYWPLLKKIRPNSTSTRANQVLYTHKHTRVQVYTVLITHWLDYFSLYAIYIFPARHQRSKAEEEARALAFIISFVFFVFFFFFDWLFFNHVALVWIRAEAKKEARRGGGRVGRTGHFFIIRSNRSI